MVIFLSAGQLEKLSARLIEGGYAPETPAAIVYKATWPDEKVVRTTVGELAAAGAREGITKTAQMCIRDRPPGGKARCRCLSRTQDRCASDSRTAA